MTSKILASKLGLAAISDQSPAVNQSSLSTYQVAIEADTLTIGFGVPGANTQIVQDAEQALQTLLADQRLKGGPLLKVYGPASIPVAFVIAHKVAHLFGAIAVFDPKLNGYVVSISHSPDYPIGTLLPHQD